MIVKINFGEKAYFSHVFLKGTTNYRERFVVFNDELERFELVCTTIELELSEICFYTFDYTYEGFIEKDLIELDTTELTECIGYPWLINNVDLIKAIDQGKEVPKEYIELAKKIHQNMNPYRWHNVETQKDLEELEYISGCFHDCYLKSYKGVFNNPTSMNRNMSLQLDFDMYQNAYDIRIEFRKDVRVNMELSAIADRIFATSFLLHDGRIYWLEGGEDLRPIDIKDYSLESLRKNIAMVFQDNFLFTGTIRENILMGNPNATELDLENAIKAAHLEEMLLELPDGLDTLLGERGTSLSGGQRQRVAIARAMIKNAPIVILDEATSALDNKSEAVVQKALDNLIKNKTVFVIAHRLSTIKNADRIAVINEGVLVELGNHNELMQIQGGQYRALYDMQFKNQETALEV